MSKPDPEVGEYLALRDRLRDQLGDVRAQFQEALANYSVRVQGELAELGDVLTADDPAGLSAGERRARIKALHESLDRTKLLELKPAKGRRRDLRAVQRLADELASTLSDW